MAACPYGTNGYSSVFCTSPHNPGNYGVPPNKCGSNIGVSWDRCIRGEVVQGLDFLHCPFYNRGYR